MRLMNLTMFLTLVILAALAHGGLAYVNYRLGTDVGRNPGRRAATVLTRIAIVAGVLGWGVPVLGLALEMCGVHALSVLPPAIIGLIPLALLCLSASLLLRFVARSGGLRVAGKRAYRFSKALIPLLGAVLLALVSLALLLMRVILDLMVKARPTWNPAAMAWGVLDSLGQPKRPTGPYYNHRTGRYDDGHDPWGIYDD